MGRVPEDIIVKISSVEYIYIYIYQGLEFMLLPQSVGINMYCL